MGSREVLGSKIGLMNSCLKFGIKIPKSVVSVQKGCISDARQIGYPLLVKSDYGHSGTGVIKCTSEAELILATGAFENDEKFLIQEYIDGDIINTESLFKNGKLLGYAYSKTIETITDEFGVSAVRAYHVFPEITPVLEKIGRVIGVNGFVNMTFMRDRMTGEHFLIEADVRPQAWVPLARFAGVDFAEAIKSYSYDPEHFKVVIPLLGTPEKPLIIRHFSRDMMRCIIHHNGREVWNWVINKDFRWRFIPWYDPVLLFWTLGRILKFWLGRLMR
jgi:predicted ATP-grasp superfamily ATP-dependent carboligase